MESISFEEARRLVLEHVPRTGPRKVAILDSLGKVLAADVVARREQPAVPHSLRDGFAVRTADLAGASVEKPLALPVAFQVAAGEAPASPLEAGTCAAIATGATLPPEADAVVPAEETELEEDRVRFTAQVTLQQYVRRPGEHFRKGDVLAPAGAVIRPEEIQAMASSGNAEVEVVSPPRVAVVSTGSELVDLEETAGRGQFWASNLYYIAAYVRLAGGSPETLRIVPDDRAEIEAAVREAEGELVVTTGGTAGGPRDYMHEVLLKLGAEVHFDEVAMSPGKSFIFATLEEKAIFCFPGSPGASRTLAWVFLCPAIRKTCGYETVDSLELAAVLEEDISTKRGRTRFLPARVRRDAEGLKVFPLYVSERELYSSVSAVNGLLLIPPDVDFLTAGYEVCVIMIGEIDPHEEELY
ncbi:MAG: molybdopterin molybdotransferase MoeA [Planctomycetota bacterium]|jgi:molybdopterin molybdotransferase